MNISGELTESQRTVLNNGSVTAIESGLSSRYHGALKAHTQLWDRLASIPNDPAATVLEQRAEKTRDASYGETPFAFSLQPSNMALSVSMHKVNSDGTEIDQSSVQIGLVGGLAGDGHSVGGFTAEDLELATSQLRQQKETGLIYGLPNGSGFLEDY
jgi:hypothetical protein